MDQCSTTTDFLERTIGEMIMDGKVRNNLKPGMKVRIVLKRDQRTSALTEGVIKAILTNSANHPHGIKVLLESGAVGRVKEVIQ